MLDGLCLIIPLVLGQDTSTLLTSSPATSTDAAAAVVALKAMQQPEETQFIKMMGPTFRDTPLMGWIALLIAIALGLAASRVLQSILKDIARRLEQRQWNLGASILRYSSGPGGLVVLALALGMGLQGVVLTSEMDERTQRILGLFYIIALAWFLFNLVDLLDLALRRIAAAAGAPTLDETVLTLLRKTLRVFLLILFVLFVAQNTFGANISAWLAGLGIAGLAVSLAAQDSVKNLFGSMTVLIERPFSLGDRIVFGAYDGTVETIGFRSTKIRTLTGNLVTVPNMKFTDGIVENISTRPWVRRTMNITITFDTPPEKVQRAVEIIKNVLAQPDIAKDLQVPDRPSRVFFNEFNADSLNILVTYWYLMNVDGRDWWSYHAHAEQINQRILRAFGDAGIDFAFPTRTVFLADDPKRPPTTLVPSQHVTTKSA